MDTDIRDELDRSFDDGPPVDDLDLILTRGHDAVRRRRFTESAAVLAVVGVVAGIAFATSGTSGGGGSVGPAGEPTAEVTPSSPPVVPDARPDVTASGPAWTDDPVRYYRGDFQVHPDAVVHRHVENPYGFESPALSDAYDLTYEGQRTWVLAEYRNGGSGYSANAPSNGWASFADWLASQVGEAGPGEDGWPETVQVDGQGRVVAAPGAEILQRTDDPQLGETFAPAGATTGAALVTPAREQASYFVVWRVIDGELDVITTPPRDIVGATFEELLTYARGQYDSGEGMR